MSGAAPVHVQRLADIVAAGEPFVVAGRLWPGGDADPTDASPSVVALDGDGRVLAVDHADPPTQSALGSRAAWIGPLVHDRHVHLAFGDQLQLLARGVGACRDWGAPLDDALRWRALAGSEEAQPLPRLAVSGPLLTAPGGYPSRTWGAGGFALFVADEAQATDAVDRLHAAGVDMVKLALEPAGGPVPTLATASALVRRAHELGLSVGAHALTAEMVERALDAGVDELVHTPTEPLPDALVRRLAGAVPVTSTLATFEADGSGEPALGNASAFVAAGGTLRYGTDLGNTGTSPGVSVRELELLAAAGLGQLGALRAATDGMASPVEVGKRARLVVLDGDPARDVTAWARVRGVVADGHLVTVG